MVSPSITRSTVASLVGPVGTKPVAGSVTAGVGVAGTVGRGVAKIAAMSGPPETLVRIP